jgi:hypothetical protein
MVVEAGQEGRGEEELKGRVPRKKRRKHREPKEPEDCGGKEEHRWQESLQ